MCALTAGQRGRRVLLLEHSERVGNKIVISGGGTLRFQPIGFRAYYPSKAFPVHPELGNRDLIEEVARNVVRRECICTATQVLACPSWTPS